MDRIDGGVNAIIAAEVGYLGTIVMLMATLALMIWVIVQILSDMGYQMFPALVRFGIRTGIIVTLVSSTPAFMQWVATPLAGLPDQLTQTVSAPLGVTGFQGDGASFDNAANSAWKAALVTFDAAPSLSIKTVFICIGIALCLVTAMLAIAMSFLPWFVAGLLLKFTLALGPIAVFCLLIPAAKGIFDGWLGVVLSAALAKVMIVMMLVLIGLTEQGTTDHIVAEAGQAGGNVFIQLQALAILGVVCFIAGITAFLLPGVAARICSGIAMSVGAYTSAASKAGSGMMAAASAGASKTASAASSASRAFTSTSRTFVGPNMSGI